MRVIALGLPMLLVGAGCDAGDVPATPPIVAGVSGAPREVNLIARDYSFVPGTLDLVPGEVILLHVINGGLVIHEAVIGDATVQDAWEVAEAATVGAPPGPTPVVAGARRRRRPADRRPLGRARGPDLDRTGRCGVSRESLGRRLPHPRALGEGDADPRPLGGEARVLSARWYPLSARS